MEKNIDYHEIESRMQQFWEENKTYAFEKNSSKPVYSIDTPPPTVSGSLHIGHIFSYTQAEMIARFKRMQGFNVFYPFGFDDNGLPTERLVEKDEGIKAKDLPRSEFINKCVQVSKKYEDEYKNLWQRMGFSVDWSLQYETINPLVQRISQKSFIKLAKDRKAYLKESPVLWCTECQTSIAQAELETRDLKSTFNYITFTCDNDELTIATTRPELLYGCVALFINPKDELNNKYIGKMAMVPLYQFEVPIMESDLVNLEKGTGIVMCCTFGDQTDLEWVETYNLPYKNVIMPNGFINEDVPYIGGLNIKKARLKIIDLLKEQNFLTKSEEIMHSVTVHERCGNEIEILPSKQWYIDIMSKKKLYIEAADEINWYPEHMKKRYIQWIENLKWDWCISRQRYYGVPIPVWYCDKCGEVIYADMEDLPINPLESKPKKACKCGNDSFIPETAVLDTWATSSCTPLINAKWGEAEEIKEHLPMSMRTQAHEIIRTWTFYTIVKSLYHTGSIPWKDIMICGYVLAKKGEKISKSKNNASLSPIQLINNYSADAIRYWAANTKLGTDTFFSTDELTLSKRFINKLWNASKFSISHLQDYNKDENILLKPIDKWIIERCRETVASAKGYLNQYEIGQARHTIDEFFWKDFCDYYLEIVKERLYQPEKHGNEERKSAQAALYNCLLTILKLYAIFTPHITEYIYQSFYSHYEEEISIHQLMWDDITSLNKDLVLFGEECKQIISKVRKYKSENNLSLKDELKSITIQTNEKYLEWFKQTESDLKACCRCEELIYIIE